MKLLAIDGDNLLRTAWEATDDASRGSVHRRVLARIVQSIAQWERTIVAFDGGPGGGAEGFRRARFPAYKANRSDPGAPYRDQRQRVIDALKYEKCTVIVGPSINVDGYEGVCEADDVLAWAAEQFFAHFEHEEDPDHVLRVVSSDGDIEYLACDTPPRVEIFKPQKSREEPIYTAKRIESERGVEPDRIPLLKALCGDKSDNYSGFKGIGEATAAMLIRYYDGDIEKIISQAPDDESIPPKELNKSQRAALREGGIDLAMQGLWLATLRGDLPLDFESIVLSPPKPEQRPKDYSFVKEPAQKPEAQSSQQAAAIELRKPETISASASINPFALQPGNLSDLYDLALALHRSGLYAHLPNPEAIMGVILDANERGVPAATAARNAYFIPGTDRRPPRLGWSAAYIAGLVLSSGKAEFFELIPEDCGDTSAALRFKRIGRPEGKHVFTIDDAKKNGYFGKQGVWQSDVKAMLRAAVTRTAARAYFPDVVSGVYMPDELRAKEQEDDAADSDAANV